MRKDRLYFFTFIAMTAIFIIVAPVAVKFFVKASIKQLLETQLESSKREAKEINALVGFQLASGLDTRTVIDNVQKSIENTNTETGFISMFDWSSNVFCHPDRTKVGQKVAADQSFVANIDFEITIDDFYEIFIGKEKANEITSLDQGGGTSGMIFMCRPENSDWIIGAHVNLSKISDQVVSLRNQFYTIFVIMGFVLILLSVITVRLIGSFYEKNLEFEKKNLESEVLNLAKLNTALGEYQQKMNVEKPAEIEPKATASKKESEGKKETAGDTGKQRILTYLRNELLPVATSEIAYIYTENTITYVVDVNGKRSTTNSSLDELYNGLDSSFFYRANRQSIIAISAIDKIIRYGNNQLKIVVKPNSDVDIIIGKNKASEFKQWLNL